MTDIPLTVAVIGAGMAGRAHANAYRQADTVFDPLPRPIRLRAIADANLDLATRAARDYGFETAYDSWEKVVEDPEIDAVSVVVGNALHRPIAEALLAAGKHVLCEKPLASGIAEARSMVAAAQGSDRVAAINYSYRRTPAIAEVQRRVAAGDIGEVTHISGHFLCDYGCDPLAPWTWRDSGDLGTGCLGDLGAHLIDLAEQICGPISTINGAHLATRITRRHPALGTTFGHDKAELSEEFKAVTNEDDAVFTTTFASEASGAFDVSRVAYGHDNSLGFTISGLKGSIGFEFDRPAQYTISLKSEEATGKGWKTVIAGPGFPYYGGGLAWQGGGLSYGYSDIFIFQIRAFLDQILGSEDPLPACGTFAEGLHTMRLIDQIAESHRSGHAVATD